MEHLRHDSRTCLGFLVNNVDPQSQDDELLLDSLDKAHKKEQAALGLHVRSALNTPAFRIYGPLRRDADLHWEI